jgi:hypothetical protein
MSRSIRIRTLPLLLTLSLLTTPAWAAGSAAAAPASAGIPSFFASLWQGLTDLLFGAGPATADPDRGPGWDPWGAPDAATTPAEPDRGPDWDPLG